MAKRVEYLVERAAGAVADLPGAGAGWWSLHRFSMASRGGVLVP